MTTFEEVCAVLDKIILSHKDGLNNRATAQQLLVNGGQILQTIPVESPFMEDLHMVGSSLVLIFKISTDEAVEVIKKYTKEQKEFFIRMFEAKLLEAQGRPNDEEGNPADYEAIIMLSQQKFNELKKHIN